MKEEKKDTEGNKLNFLKDELSSALGQEQEERLKFLKREEIRTMKKDVERLREIEAEKERERIIALETEKEKEKLIVLETEKRVTVKKPELEEEPREEKRLKEEERLKEEKVKEEETKEEREEEKVKEEELKEEERLKEEPRKEEELKEEKKPEEKQEIQIQETLIPKPPKRPSNLKKILTRIGFVLISVSLIGLIYWAFFYERPFPEDITPPVKEPILKEEPILEERPEIITTPPFIPVEKILTFEISENEEIPQLIENLVIENLPQKAFTQIVIKNIKENRQANLEDIAQAFQIETVPAVMQKLEIDNFNLLVYPQEEGKREVFIIKIKEKDLLEPLKVWEAKIVQEGLYISNNKISTLASFFRNFNFKEENFNIRFLTISKEDSGLCYGLFEDYIILSSSFESIEKAVKELNLSIYSKLREKIGQLFIIGFEGSTITPQLEDFFKKYKPGGVLLLSKNIENKQQLKSLIEELQKISLKETGLPLFIAVDQEGGPITRIGFLEEKTSQSEINDTDTAYQIGLKRAEELRDLGVNINLAPLLDHMKVEDFYYNRSFQKTPSLSGELAKSLVLGQKQGGVLTTIKHFPGYVNVSFNPEVKLATILTPEISQFKKTMEAEPELVMVSNAIYTDIDPSLPLTFSEEGILYLKQNLGSKPLVVSDDLAQNSLLEKFPLIDILTKPIEAGVDILIFSGWRAPVNTALDECLEAVKNKAISEAKIDAAVSRIIKLKQTIQ